MKKKPRYETLIEENGRLKQENYKLANELVNMKERMKNNNPEIICPVCKKAVKSTGSRIKIVEFIRNPNIQRSYDNNAWKSRTLQNFHPNCWRKKYGKK